MNMKEQFNQGFRTFGESAENLREQNFIQQPDDHSCALRSQQIILRDFGIDIPFDDLEKIALEAGVYTNHGTYTDDIGKVLEIAGVGVHQVAGGTIYDLTNELAQGHRVMVSVDANELWYNDTTTGKLTNWISDAIGHQGGNHALIVAGVEVDMDNPNNVKVVLTDPGAGDLRIEYPIEQFMDAWRDSNCFMVATDNAAPYQYDATMAMEVPSNFAVDYHINDLIAQNSWQLSGDEILYPTNYQPAFTGHINNIGDVTYESFSEKYEKLVSARHSINGESPADIIHTLCNDIHALFHHSSTEMNNDIIEHEEGNHGNNSAYDNNEGTSGHEGLDGYHHDFGDGECTGGGGEENALYEENTYLHE